MTDLVGTTLGQYQIVELIGEGGMANVYKAWQPSLRRYVALKVLAPHLADDDDFLKRFQREAVSAANLKHINIVTIHDVGVEDGRHYIAMEFIEGTSLAEWIRSGQLVAPEQVVDIISQIGSALDYAHQRGFIHRDIKPANVLIEPSGRAVLTDFGIAKAVSSATAALTQVGSIFGTPHYMSPEQVREEELDHLSDLYSLGIVCYEMLTGDVPFDGTTTHSILYAQANHPPPPLREVNPAIAPPVEAVVSKMLSKGREKRYGSAGEFALALAQAIAGVWPEEMGEDTVVGDRAPVDAALMETVVGWGVGQDATVVTDRSPVGMPARRRRWPRVLGVLLLALVVVGAVVGVLVLRGGGKGESELERAEAALAAGNYVEAVYLFEKVLANKPGNVEALDGLLEVAGGLAQAEEHDQGIATFKRVLMEDADNVEALKGIGEIYEAQKQWQQSADWYEKWTQVVPDDPQARLKLGEMFFLLKDYEKAVAQFKRLTEVRPQDVEGWKGLALSLQRLGNWQETIIAAKEWSDLSPNDSEAYRNLGDAYYQTEDLESAQAAYQRWTEIDPDSDYAHRSLGWAYYRVGQYQQAVSEFEQSLELQMHRSAYEGLVDSYVKLDDSQNALTTVQEWTKFSPDDPLAYRKLGDLCYQARDFQCALQSFEKWRDLTPDSAPAYTSIGWAYFQLGDYELAAENFKVSLEFENHLSGLTGLAQSYFEMQRYGQSVQVYERILLLDPDNAQAYRGLGNSHYNLGEYDEALRYFRRWVELAPESAEALRSTGWAWFQLGEFEKAIEAFHQSLDIVENANTYYALGESYHRLGDCDQAVPYLRKTLEMDPNHPAAADRLRGCGE